MFVNSNVLVTCPFGSGAHYQPEFFGVRVDLLAYTRKELEEMERAGHQILK
jgi:hypothetical protein